MRIQKQSRLEGLVKNARIAAGALALTLVPGNLTATSGYNHTPQAIETEHRQLGRAHQLLQDFSEWYQIPGAAYPVDKYQNPEANYFLILVRKPHEPFEQEMSRRYGRQLRRAHNDTYLIYSYLIRHLGIEEIYREAVTPETSLDFDRAVLDMQMTALLEEIRREKPERFSRQERRRIHRSYAEQQESLSYDAVMKLAVEDRIHVLPAETLETNKRTGELFRRALSDEINAMDPELNFFMFRKRELELLDFGSRQENPFVLADFGGMHAHSIVRSIEEWNSKPENRYRQFCAAIITPRNYD